jgi:hypothetical protein
VRLSSRMTIVHDSVERWGPHCPNLRDCEARRGQNSSRSYVGWSQLRNRLSAAAAQPVLFPRRASGGGTSRDLRPPGWPGKYAALQAGWNDAAGAGHGREVGTTRMASYERSYAGGLVFHTKQQSDPLPRGVVSASFASSRNGSLSPMWLTRAVTCWSLAASLGLVAAMEGRTRHVRRGLLAECAREHRQRRSIQPPRLVPQLRAIAGRAPTSTNPLLVDPNVKTDYRCATSATRAGAP